MEGGKKIIAAVVLVVVIVVVLVLVLRSQSVGVLGGPRPPAWVLDQQVEKIDMESLDVVTKKLREWESLGHDKMGRYKGAKGKFTMVSPMTCEACKVKIPVPDMPTGTADKPATPEEMMAAQKAAKCPKCGKNPYPMEMRK